MIWDILSRLPVNVINIIRMHLPLGDVRKLSELTLDQILYDTTKENKSPVIQFDNILKHLKANRVGQITKFILDVTCLESWPVIYDKTYFLSRNGIQHLVLNWITIHHLKSI
ncbi:hypothetical protein H5410_027159 [Solanum commersonii]|uniref:Uncharacterized protein n=1 Tax=Solanum commersonii TaxID=4109 RepID=A0A9J5YY92_SOLCO|nr:hypothetical protein H5410_027159 [Solanum commersonii]